MNKLITITGPSGVGKTTVANFLLKHPIFDQVITATTRSPRAGEENGVHYHFYTIEEFESRIQQDQFLEHARIYDYYYGTPRQSVQNILMKKRNALATVDIQGVRSILRQNFQPWQSYFLMPPSLEELENRLRGRGTETEEEIQKRLTVARQEIAQVPDTHFDRIITNDSSQQTAAIILGEILSCPIVK